ncbi:hypothetical protein [Hyphococcus sp. DH-69]
MEVRVFSTAPFTPEILVFATAIAVRSERSICGRYLQPTNNGDLR